MFAAGFVATVICEFCCCCCCNNWSSWSCCSWFTGIAWAFPCIVCSTKLGCIAIIELFPVWLIWVCCCCWIGCCCCCCCCCCWLWMTAVKPDEFTAACKMPSGWIKAGITDVVTSWLNTLVVLFEVGFVSAFSFFGFRYFFQYSLRPCSGGSLLPP